MWSWIKCHHLLTWSQNSTVNKINIIYWKLQLKVSYTDVYKIYTCWGKGCCCSWLQTIIHFIIILNIDRTLYTLWLVKTPCFIRVENIENVCFIVLHKANVNEEAWAVYFIVIKRSGHLRTLKKCRKHFPAVNVLYISLVISNAHRVLSQCNTQLRLLSLLNIQSSCSCAKD